MSEQINVVGAIIRQNGLVLCAQRGKEKSLPGLWEFPGGKIEPGETMQDALRREVFEELSCNINVGSKVVTTIYEYDFGSVSLTTFYCELISGSPSTTEHASIIWLDPENLSSLEWAPADIPAVAQIQRDLY